MRNFSKLLIVVFFAICCLFWFILHQYAGFTLPLPWPDEVVFYYGGKNFSEFHSLLVPELNPDRILRWFPPGFAVIFGIFQSLFTDGSFENSRMLMGGIMLEAFLMLALFCWRLQARFASLFLCLCALFSMHAVIAGNIIRPEAVIMFVFAGGLALAAWRKELLAISVLLIAPLIHPVSIIAVLPMIILCLIYAKDSRKASNWWQWLVLGLVISFYVVFSIDINRNWLDAKNDFIWQLSSRDFTLLKIAFKQVNNWVALACCALIGINAIFKKQRLVILITTAAMGLLLVRIVGQGYWYGIYRRAAIILICIGLIESLNVFWIKYFNNSWQSSFNFLAVLVVGEVLLLVGALNPNFTTWTWEGMHLEASSSGYLTSYDLKEVRYQLDSISERAKPGYIVFYPAGDMCFYNNLLPLEQKPIMPVFTAPVPSMVLFHNSKFHTDLIRSEGLEWMRQYLPYISSAHGFTTSGGNAFTIFILQPRPALSYKYNPRSLYPQTLTDMQ